MKEIKALYSTNAREFLRDLGPVFLVLLLPVAFASFFGLIFDGGSGDASLQLGLVIEDSGPAGERFLEELEARTSENVLALHTGDRDEMLQALNEGDVGLVLVLPEGMSAALGAGEQVTVEVFYDSTQSISAAMGPGAARTILSEANLALSGVPAQLVMAETDVQTSPQRNIDLFMPGMLGIAMLWLGLFGTALPLIRQRTGQVLRRLSLTPVRPAAMLFAQVAWRVTVGLIQAALFLLVGYLLFKVGVDGNKLLFLGAVILGTLVFTSLGYLLAGLASSEEGLIGMAQIVNFPLMFLSGGLFPVENLPSYLQPLVTISPLSYLTDTLKQLMVSAPALHPLWLNFTVLAGWLILLLALGIRFWRWE